MQPVDVAQGEIADGAALEQLKAFCRGEMSAVETYRQAIEAAHDTWAMVQLRQNLASHERRVHLLKCRILELGGDPPEGFGPWGTFVKVVEGAAATLGEKMAISVLEQGEVHGLDDYRANLDILDPASLRLVRDVILPQQMQTRRMLTDMKHRLS